MKGQKACHLWLLILFLVTALTVKISRSDDKTNEASLSRLNSVDSPHEANVQVDKDEGKINKSSSNNVVMNKGRRGYYGGGGGGGGGSSGGGIGYGGGGGWGWGGGGGGWWGWGCRKQKKDNGNVHKKRGHEYIMGEFAQCMGIGRCKWKRLDCPLHCGGDCFYDCKHMCKAHCSRR
ncbi:RNA-binding protein cabeza-like [Heracleum sosnowskyi]|uniref:RNA-binding protein cabeza-like n=1 Tax=Heracleum sosnowskyi TaxID=360622 RepID=A0AAD8J9X8_9APIA|nr:RNA-binding protein cabeza-like [Heracleum sosnowskyi]